MSTTTVLIAGVYDELMKKRADEWKGKIEFPPRPTTGFAFRLRFVGTDFAMAVSRIGRPPNLLSTLLLTYQRSESGLVAAGDDSVDHRDWPIYWHTNAGYSDIRGWPDVADVTAEVERVQKLAVSGGLDVQIEDKAEDV